MSQDDVINPAQLKWYLDQFIVGQKAAKIKLCVAVKDHCLRVARNSELSKAGLQAIQKSNVLLLGPSGCGKTFLIETIARRCNLPLSIADATTLTEVGYVGQDVESILTPLVSKAGGDLSLAAKGIVYLDEFDKLAKRDGMVGRDVSGEGVQRGLLRLLEGTIARVPVAGQLGQPPQFVELNTRDILFICGGAFTGLDKLAAARKIEKPRLGFQSAMEKRSEESTAAFFQSVEDRDLIKYGIMQELVGRLPMRAVVHALGVDELKKILTEPRNAILTQQKELLKPAILAFTEEAVTAIATEASRCETGARALKQIVEDLLLPIKFSAMQGLVQVTADMVESRHDFDRMLQLLKRQEKTAWKV